jgi:hypothetical protein
MAAALLPQEGQGFRAEMKIADDKIFILLAIYTVQGFVAAIYDSKCRKVWNDESADFEDAKAKAESIAHKCWTELGCSEDQFPTLDWKPTS